MYFFAHDCIIIRPAGTFQLGQANVCSFLVNLLKSATILNNFNINHQQISLLKMPQVYSAIFYRLMMSFNVISYVSNNASHICCYRAKRSCFQHWVLRIFRTRGGKKKSFLAFPVGFKIPIIFSYFNYNCSNVLDLRNLHEQVITLEQVKKTFCFKICSDLLLFE